MAKKLNISPLIPFKRESFVPTFLFIKIFSFFLISSNVFGAEGDDLSDQSTPISVRTVGSTSSATVVDSPLPPAEVELVVVETRTRRSHRCFVVSSALLGFFLGQALIFEFLPKREAVVVLIGSMVLVCMGYCCPKVCKRR